LLEYLMMRQGLPTTRAEIVEHVWKLSGDTLTNVVDVYINYLRQKIDDRADCKLIHTVRGIGYEMRSSLGGDLHRPRNIGREAAGAVV
jgi:DNA-binding response OmpR family regulator